ncbi:uncharacterized protein LOC122394468 [Amphibalanus amphitrite]|uniref:uncharacterized protein LOC122394468 n=1 Tax=Amphibalanus amphitrite TaxID=1232801 RepID=UPI001C92AD9A|nr:uncharacterized protein LOC122394468 [Amphibalanus amphitrite]
MAQRGAAWPVQGSEGQHAASDSVLDRARFRAQQMAHRRMAEDGAHPPGRSQDPGSSRGYEAAPQRERGRKPGGRDGAFDIISELDLNFLAEEDSYASDLTAGLTIVARNEKTRSERRDDDLRDLTSGLDLLLPRRRSPSPNKRKMRKFLNDLATPRSSRRSRRSPTPPRKKSQPTPPAPRAEVLPASLSRSSGAQPA